MCMWVGPTLKLPQIQVRFSNIMLTRQSNLFTKICLLCNDGRQYRLSASTLRYDAPPKRDHIKAAA